MNIEEHKCNAYPFNSQIEQIEQNNIPVNPLKKKENPALDTSKKMKTKQISEKP